MINCVKQSSWKPISRSAGHEIPHLWDPDDHYYVNWNRPVISFLNQINLDDPFIPNSSKIHFNIILKSKLRYSKGLLIFASSE